METANLTNKQLEEKLDKGMDKKLYELMKMIPAMNPVKTEDMDIGDYFIQTFLQFDL